MDVGIRELKRRLSEFVERAARGEVILVTHRGKPKAQLTPLPGRQERDPLIERGIREGWITPPETDEPPVFPKRRFKGGMTVQELLDEDRGV